MSGTPREPLSGVRKTTVTLEYAAGAGSGERAPQQSQLSWYPGTADATIERLAKCALGLRRSGGGGDDAAAPLLVVDATSRAPCRRDAYPLTATVPHGSTLRALTVDEWLALPDHHARSRAASDAGMAGGDARSASGPSFMKAYVDSLTRTEVGVLPTVQCCIHVNAIVEVNPQSETFLCDVTVICDWIDERLGGMTKQEIQEILGDETQYSKPLISLANQVDADNHLSSVQPRCENTKTGACKITARLQARLHSSMDVHAFPFDSQTLYVETHLRSITVDKSKLEKGQKGRLYVVLEDASRGIVNTKRANNIAPAADKVQEWDFVTSPSRMAELLEPYREQQRAHEDVRRKLAHMMHQNSRGAARADFNSEVLQLLDEEEALVKRVNALLPRVAPAYQPRLCNSQQGTHVVGFAMARQPHSLTWTLFIPIVVITTLSFSQFGIDPQLLEERLGIIFTALLTIVAFQYVVRESVPDVPYMTLMDQFVTQAIGALFLQCIASLYVSTLADAYHTTRKVLPVENAYTKSSNKLLQLLIKAVGNGTSAADLAEAAAVDTTFRCDEECGRAKEVDVFLRWTLVGMWAACVLYFVWKARAGRTRMAFFHKLTPLVPIKTLCKLDSAGDGGQRTRLMSAGQVAAIQKVLRHKDSAETGPRRGSLEWKQEMSRAESTRVTLGMEATAQRNEGKHPTRLPPIEDNGSSNNRKVVPVSASDI